MQPQPSKISEIWTTTGEKAIWQIVVCGFGGLRLTGGKLKIHPRLPASVKSLRYPLNWKGNPLVIWVREGSLTIENKGHSPVELTVNDEVHTVGKELQLET